MPTIHLSLDPKYDWYQNMTHAFVSYKVKGGEASESTIKTLLTEDSFALENCKTGEILAKADLSNKIDNEKCSVSYSARVIEVKLKKADEKIQWGALEKGKAGGINQVPMAAPADKIAYPTSSKQKKDWSKIDQEIERDLNKDKPEGEEAMNSLFKQIYERSDPETRRAMIKSYQTSGGTVLSTNWGEVKAKDYDGVDRPSAPDGQEWADKV